jgi:4-hydroxy-tetrahydrodipicolinate synthase
MQQTIIVAFSMGTFPVVVKEAMKLAGLPAGDCRRPVGNLSAEERERLRVIVEEALAAPRGGVAVA